MIKDYLLSALAFLFMNTAAQADNFHFGTTTNPHGRTILVDQYGVIMDGQRKMPVMGEMHYSRVPRNEWQREIRKMRAGGITILSTYVFWNHHEAVEGHWDWSGNRDLHAFLQICSQEGMLVVLRIGPFAHGEVWQGGFPKWIVSKAQAQPSEYKLRSLAPGFIAATQRLYSNIFAQASDMLWKHGGPVIGVQIENECRGPWAYYTTLKDIAVSIGFDVPLYTRTGWPRLTDKEEFGKMLPLYGDYADGFWDRSLKDMPGDYAKAFIMKTEQVSATIATETFSDSELASSTPSGQSTYPYLTCELGGGMMPSYHRRINMSGSEAFPLAVCKLGSGSNLLGYYMYHGGTNPVIPGKTMAECQDSPVTNYNDMPHVTYDFQAPLGEMGQPDNKSYHQTRWLHQFLYDWGEELAVMAVDSLSDHYATRGQFVFCNDYVRILNEQGTASVTPRNMLWQGLSISSQSVQPYAKADSCLYFIALPGQKPVMHINGKKYSPKFDRIMQVQGRNICVLSQVRARSSYVIDGSMHYASHGGILYKGDDDRVVEEYLTATEDVNVEIAKLTESKGLREVKMGRQKVAEQPSESDFGDAAIWDITLKAEAGPSIRNEHLMTMDLQPSALDDAENYFLCIEYQGDAARVYADGTLVQDNFWNGKPMLVRLSDLVRPTAQGSVCRKIELRILPLGKDYPIYLQKEQADILKAAEGDSLLKLLGVKVIRRKFDVGS